MNPESKRMAKPFYGDRNEATRVDLFDELSENAQSALRAFFRRMGAPHLFDEVLIPLLLEGDSQVFAAVRDRPWPPWGLGARYISAVCQTHLIIDRTYGISPVYVADEDLSNIGLMAAVYKEALEYLAYSVEGAEINYLVVEGSTLADHVLRRSGFEKTEDVFLTEAARYFTYRIPAVELLANLGLEKVSTPDLLSHEIDPRILERNALFHSSIYLSSRAEWMINEIWIASEISRLVRGGHFSKPGGVPTGTGRYLGYPADLVAVTVENFLESAANRELFDFLVQHEADFTPGTVVLRDSDQPVVNEQVRRAKTLDDLGRFRKLIAEHIRENLAEILQRLEYEPFPLGEIEVQVTASGDGDYFRMHRDSDERDNREITCVYYVFNEPRRFSGGELRIFETEIQDDRLVPTDQQQTISPRQNMAVFFPSRHEHEVLPTRVPSKAFGDSRFSITAWIHRA